MSGGELRFGCESNFWNGEGYECIYFDFSRGHFVVECLATSMKHGVEEAAKSVCWPGLI